MEILFGSATHVARELAVEELPRLQAFFDANPEYYLTVSGAPPRPTEAQEEFDEWPPAHIPHGRRWFLGFFERDDDGPGGAGRELQGVAIVVRDLGAAGVWHLALYLWATRLHGSGAARAMHDAFEAWALRQGAEWLRLGVVVGNARAERFWARLGYTELRRRTNIPAGTRSNEVRLLLKPLRGGTVEQYLSLAPRDHPESSLP